jgi:hypothetical protein
MIVVATSFDRTTEQRLHRVLIEAINRPQAGPSAFVRGATPGGRTPLEAAVERHVSLRHWVKN